MAETSELNRQPGGAGRWAVLRVAWAECGKASSTPGVTTRGWPVQLKESLKAH